MNSKFYVAMLAGLFFLYGCAGVIKPENWYKLSESRYNKVEKSYGKVLITATGSPMDRVFFDNLMESFTPKLEKKGVHNVYTFLGNTEKLIKTNLKESLKQDNYDAILIMHPVSLARVTEINNSFNRSRTIAEQRFLLQVYDHTNVDVPVWEAYLQIHINFTEDKHYPVISDAILKRFTNNFLCR